MSRWAEGAVMYGMEVKTRAIPLPGELWLRSSDDVPCIITSLTHDRVSFVVPQADPPGHRESYCGAEYFFEEEWVRIWPPSRGES
jgi:hypothetical protein